MLLQQHVQSSWLAQVAPGFLTRIGSASDAIKKPDHLANMQKCYCSTAVHAHMQVIVRRHQYEVDTCLKREDM